MKKLLFISLAVVLALTMALVGCGNVVTYDLTIASTTGGSTTPGTGSHSYAPATVVDIKATPASAEYHFVNWSGDVGTIADVNDATTTITMNAAYSIKANFDRPWTSTITLSLHLTMPPEASLWTKVYQPWVAEVENLTGSQGGKFKFDVTFGPEPWDEGVGLAAITAGVSDLGQLNGDQFKLGTISYIPFLWTMEEGAYATYKLFNTEVGTWDKFGELDGVKILLSTPLQPAQWWGNVDVKTLADLSGKLVRCEDPEVPTIDALGATPVTGLEAGDLAGALKLGTIDGCFFTYSAWSFGIVDATHYTTQVNLFPRLYVLAMNKDKYDSLPADAKTALDSLCTAAESVKLAKAHDAGQAFGIAITKGFADMPGDGKVSNPRMPYVLPAAELANWKTATAGLAPEWVATMNGLGFDGTAMYNRAKALIAEYDALP